MALFRRLFRGRDDVYPVPWESKKNGHSGYTPACANEWREGICDKRNIKCSDCGHRQLLPLTDTVIYGHLAGKHTIGVYPLLKDDRCHFLAVDFDEAEWRQDAWKGSLQQYAGRLHREHASKTDVRIIDFVDTGHPTLLRMWARRQQGYRAIGYRIAMQSELAGW